MAYITTISGKEFRVVGISFGGKGNLPNDPVIVTLEQGALLRSKVHELTGSWGYYPTPAAHDTRDLLENIKTNPAIEAAFKGAPDQRQAACIEAFQSIGLTENDFSAFMGIVTYLRESRELSERMDGHVSQRIEDSAYYRRR